MKKGVLLFLMLVVGGWSHPVYASQCNLNGYTVIYVNGILTDENSAKKDTKSLQKKFEDMSNLTDVKFLTAYNPPHLGGVGDLIESAAQKLGGSVSDYDLENMLTQMHQDLTTQKVVLVGHSQGTLYTNQMYDYLVNHGVPVQSIRVYNIATPDDHVSGYRDPTNHYLSSSNDEMINEVRFIAQHTGTTEPLPANILLEVPDKDKNDSYGGHYFSTEYLANAPARIVNEINSELGEVQNPRLTDTKMDGCFVPPLMTLAHNVQSYTLPVADFAFSTTGTAISFTIQSPIILVKVGASFAYATLQAGVYVMSKTVSIMSTIAQSVISKVASAATLIPSKYLVAGVVVPSPTVVQKEIPKTLPPLVAKIVLPVVVSSAPTPANVSYSNSIAAVVPVQNTAVILNNLIQQLQAANDLLLQLQLTQPHVLAAETNKQQVVGATLLSPGYGGGGGMVRDGIVVSEVVASTTLVVEATTTVATSSTDDVATSTVLSTGTSTPLSAGTTTSATSTPESATSTIVTIITAPINLVMSEIAWVGTTASRDDVWVELHNTGTTSIDLTGSSLENADGSFSIPLSGVIAPEGASDKNDYYLIEYRQEATNVTADLISNDLKTSESGTQLLLTFGTGNDKIVLDKTSVADQCYGTCGEPRVQYRYINNILVKIPIHVSTIRYQDNRSYQSEYELSDQLAHDADGNIILGSPRGFSVRDVPHSN